MGITNTSLPSDLYMAFNFEPLMAVWKHDDSPKKPTEVDRFFCNLSLDAPEIGCRIWEECMMIMMYIHVSLEETDNPNMLAETLLPVFFRCGFIDLFVSIAMAQKEKSWA